MTTGIRECEIIQWFVEPGARVEEFDKICEVQSDKASVDIPSRFSGVIKRLHYDAGEMAKVGKPLIDIDVPEDGVEVVEKSQSGPLDGAEARAESVIAVGLASTIPENPSTLETKVHAVSGKPIGKSKYATLATPAVRHLSKELDVDISEINGTGKDGRVTKEDVHQFAKARDSVESAPAPPAPASQPLLRRPLDHGPQTRDSPTTHKYPIPDV